MSLQVGSCSSAYNLFLHVLIMQMCSDLTQLLASYLAVAVKVVEPMGKRYEDLQEDMLGTAMSLWLLKGLPGGTSSSAAAGASCSSAMNRLSG